jgi:cyclophilin family peptidyl-prolyl cis-trans isomerase
MQVTQELANYLQRIARTRDEKKTGAPMMITLTPARAAPALLAALLTMAVALATLASGASAGEASADEASAGDRPVVRLETTDGDIDIELYPDNAPKTVENFLSLVDNGFYDGLIFHRVVAGFVIQAGGYDANLVYRSPPGTVVNESANRVKNEQYTVAMARLSDPDSADTQFYINLKDNPNLDWQPGRPGYTVFGRVVAGMDVVTTIELVDTHAEQGMAGVPEQDVIIKRATRL